MKNKALWEKYQSFLLGQALTKKRIKKLLQMFKVVDRGMKKPMNKASRNDIEKFVADLQNNKIKRKDGKEYSGNSKADVRRFLKQFYKWYLGDNEFFPKEVAWIKRNVAKDEQPEEKPTVTLQQIKEIANKFQKQQFKILTLLLFDSGFRISEMLSVRKKDLTWEDADEKNKCFWIYCRESKTFTRKIPITLFTEDIQEFYNSSYYGSLKQEDLLFNVNYFSYVKSLRNASMKVIGKRIVPHALRHSSATFYSSYYKGNMQMVADRFGWTYDSKQLKLYIRRSGVYQKDSVKVAFENETGELKKQLEEHEDKLKKMQKALDILNNKLNNSK